MIQSLIIEIIRDIGYDIDNMSAAELALLFSAVEIKMRSIIKRELELIKASKREQIKYVLGYNPKTTVKFGVD